MSDQSLHPGIICAIALIPTILIVIITLTILKGFNLLPQPGTWWENIQYRKHSAPVVVTLVDPAGGSFSTIESNFIGQARNESVTSIRRPPPVHHARKTVIRGRNPFSPTRNQERQIHASPQSEKDQQRQLQ
ncbi:Putative ribokinase [Hypoxylon texense]